MSEQIGLIAGFVLTLMVFSYLLGDNILYRLALAVFVGLSAGYLTLVTLDTVLIPWANQTLLNSAAGLGLPVIGVIPFGLALLLLLKGVPRYGRLGNAALAFLIGVGTAVALVGAIVGTLIPLARATGSAVQLDALNGFLLFLGVAGTLIYFQYLARRTSSGGTQRTLPGRALGFAGQLVVVITLGAIYAGAILTSLTIFSDRLLFVLSQIVGGPG
ncbi:MAG TPA: hypothetical protein PLQ56_13250 [Aggregatilineales bacterium]|nr:hypothetical protein [Anaerolineae bacterium]HUN07568.1 hypothetical protein [Aggregatilineales bacterium]